MAKILLNGLTNYRVWQMKKYGNIIPGIESIPESELINSGLEELSRLAEWISGQSQPDRVYAKHPPPINRVNRLRIKKRFGKRFIYLAIRRLKKLKK